MKQQLTNEKTTINTLSEKVENWRELYQLLQSNLSTSNYTKAVSEINKMKKALLDTHNKNTDHVRDVTKKIKTGDRIGKNIACVGGKV